MNFPGLVLDTSAAMALFFQEEGGEQIEKLLADLVSGNGQVFVPALFWYEVGNTITTALRRKRITADDVRGVETDISELPIITDSVPDEAVRIRTREIAVSKNVTYYDAAYIELAQRLDIQLISFDKNVNVALEE